MIICHHRHLSHLSQDPDSISRIFLEQLFSSSDTDAPIPSTPLPTLCYEKNSLTPLHGSPPQLDSLAIWNKWCSLGPEVKMSSTCSNEWSLCDKKIKITQPYTRWSPRVYFLEELCTRSGRMVRKRSARLTDGSPFLRQINCIHPFFSSIFLPRPPHPPFLSSKSPPEEIWHKCYQMLSEIYDHPMLIIMEGSNNQHYPRWDLSSHLYWRKFQTHYLQNLRFIKFPRR